MASEQPSETGTQPSSPRPARRAWPWALGIVALAALGIACTAQAPPTVDVGGRPSAVASLVGTWRGDYTSAATGRSGIIRFHLAHDGETATGDVTMLTATNPTHRDHPYERSTSLATDVLSIHLVQVDDAGTVAGVLEPYRDPACGCTLSTSFVGHIVGDRITGRFISHGGPGHLPTTGRWQAVRY